MTPPLTPKPTPEKDTTPPAPKGPSVTFNKRQKPDIEGITIPNTVQRAPLTKAEKKLIEDVDAPQPRPFVAPPKIVQERIVMPPHRSGFLKTLFYIICLVIVATVGYVVYTKLVSAPTTPVATDQPMVEATPTDTPIPTSLDTTMASSSTSTAIALITPTPAATVKISSTPTGYLNVRSSPSSSATAISKVHPGETYAYTDTKSGWYKITLTDGSSGWISGQYATKQ